MFGKMLNITWYFNMKAFLRIFIWLISISFITAQDKNAIKSYREADSLASFYINSYQFEKAVDVLEYAKTKFPNYLFRIIDNLASVYLTTEQLDKVMETYEYGLANNVFYMINPASPVFIKLYKDSRFAKFISENNKLFQDAKSKTKAKYEVVLPSNYDSTKSYPLFIALHGYSGNARSLMSYWKSDKMLKDYIVAYLQSSQLVGMYQYGWLDIEKAREDLKIFYGWLREKYKINEDKILIGGVSQGGEVSIDAVLNDVIPINGFVAVIPAGRIMKDFNDENISKAFERKVVGSVIIGEKDGAANYQKKIVDAFKNAGMPIQQYVYPELGHQVPRDISLRLEEAIKFIENEID